VTSKYLWRVALICVLSVALSTNAEADQLKTNADHALAGIIAGVAGVAVVSIVVIHETTKKRTITGCINSVENGMTMTDEKDKRVYTLSGDRTGVKPGERMTLQGKKFKPNDGKSLFWETDKITEDFGVCQPGPSTAPSPVSGSSPVIRSQKEGIPLPTSIGGRG
jgi:hypothetical protein